MKLKYILPFATAFIIGGCSQSATSVFDKEPIYAQNFQYTKQAKIIKGDEVLAIVNATYLNSTDAKKWDNGKQNLLVNVYLSNEDNKKEPNLKLNGKKFISKKLIKKHDEFYKNIPMRNKWAPYYIYTFEDVETSNITLNFKDSKYGSINIIFEKE